MRSSVRPLALALLLVVAGCSGATVDTPTAGDETPRAAAPATPEPVVTATVTRVVDGDTVTVRAANGTVVTERSY